MLLRSLIITRPPVDNDAAPQRKAVDSRLTAVPSLPPAPRELRLRPDAPLRGLPQSDKGARAAHSYPLDRLSLPRSGAPLSLLANECQQLVAQQGRRPVDLFGRKSFHVGRGQQGEGMDAQYVRELLDLSQCWRLQIPLDRTDVGAAGYQSEIFLGH